MIDPVRLTKLSLEEQITVVLQDVAAACERALAVIPPDHPLCPDLSCAASGLQRLVGRPQPRLTLVGGGR